MNNGEIKGYYGIYNNGLLELVNGKIIGIGAQGIYSYGTTNIYGGRIEGKTYGVYSSGTDKVTIGREEDELSTTQPAIYGGNYGIYMSNETYSFNFYNGVIISNTKETAYRGQANLRTGHMTYTYIDYEVEQKYCTILVPIVGNIEMEAEPTTFTNQNVTVKIIYPVMKGITREYSEDGTEWKQAEGYVQEVIIEENKIIYARTINESGVITEEKQLEVTNIDKEKPTVEVTPAKTKYTVIETNGTVDLNIKIKAQDTGVSGLSQVQYAWVEEGKTPNYTDFTNEITINKTKLKIGTYYLYIHVTDKAGNKADLEQMRYTVEYQEPVCQIGNTKYLTIQEAVETCSKTAGESQTTIIMIKSTDEEFITYEGQNIILDLKGYTIGSSNSNTPICTNNGTLQIIDTSTGKTGKLESLNGMAIENKGTLTIGDNSTGIEMEVPTIYGKQIGIKNENVFNFYDGKIQGIAPIQGSVTSTPEGYGPVSTGYEDGITTIQLGIVSGYEARIEWVYYTTVQGAVDATKLYKGEYRDTVTIIKNVQLKEIVQISTAKNIMLDLNGYELTIMSGNDRVIDNYGNLEIIDNSVENKGKIKSVSGSYSIYNTGTGVVKITGGSCSGIYNVDNGKVEVTGGTADSYGGIYSYGIYNASTGSVEITEGNSYPICNASSGKVKVTGGTIIAHRYGIYNASTGSVELIEGTITNYYGSGGSGIYNASTGNVTIKGGTINSDFGDGKTYGYGIYNAGNIEIIEGTINSSCGDNSECYGIYNSNTGNITIKGGTVSSSGYSDSRDSTSYGIYNSGTGSIVITGGKISSNATYQSYGIYNESTGSITIGLKEQIISKEEPCIKGEVTGTSIGYGIKNLNGNLEFYNGIIQGDTTLIGTITKIRDGYEVRNGIIEGKSSLYLAEKVDKGYIVQIEGEKYKSLQEAINTIRDNEEKTIEVLQNFELNETIEFNKNVKLDLKGKTINNKYYKIENTGNLRIVDTSSIVGNIQNTNEMIGIFNSKDGNLVLEKGKITSSKYCGIYNIATGSVTIAGGTVSGGMYGIYNEGEGSVEITEGTIIWNGNSGTYGIYNKSKGNVRVTGGTVNGSYGIYNDSSGSIEITGGTVNGSDGIYNDSTGSVEVTGGTVSGNSHAIYNRTGSVEIRKGTINGGSYGIYNTSGGSIEITGGMVSSNSIGKSYGIYNNYRTSSVTIGIKGDGAVSQGEPYIKGTSTRNNGYGIYNTSGKLYYYDGKIEGTTKAVDDTITEREENTELNYNENETILTLNAQLTNVAQIGITTYPTLQKAIETVKNEQTTIKILRNVTYTSQDADIIIPNNKNIILDLNGYKLTSTIPNQVIKNEGILEIIDTSNKQTGTIITSEETTIKNMKQAKLTISAGTIENRTKQAIYNEGEVKLVKGTVNGSYGIYNDSSGSVEITGGTVNGSYGIYNASTGSVEITGGTVNGSYGIYNVSTGSVTIGKKGDGTISQEEPYIKGNIYGIFNTKGNLCYYDGKIEGSTRGINGNITEIEEKTELLITKDTSEIIQLEGKEADVVELNGIEYDSVEKAVQASENIESTIKLLRDVGAGATIIIEENQNIIIDLNGYTLNNYIELQNEGILKIIDTSTEQTGKIVVLTGTAISNTGTMTLEGGSISDSGYGIENTGTLNMTGGSITNNTYGIYNETNGTTTITEGTISSNTYGLYNYASSSTININGGNITSNQYGIYNSNGTTNIFGAGITNNDYGIYNAGGTTNIKERAEVQSNIGVYNASGTVNIGEQGSMNPDSPVITGETYGLVNSTTITYMYDGQVRGKEGATQGYITYTESGYAVANKTEGEYSIDYLALAGTVETVAEVNGIAFSNLQSAINSVIGEEVQTVKLTNGVILNSTLHIAEGQNIILDMNEKTISSNIDITIQNEGNLTIIDSTSSGVGKISSTVGVAIENSGTLTLGQDDGTVSQDLITIEGNTYGIVNSGTLNFYDGTINGASAIQGVITNRPEGYVIRITTVNGKERYYLST